MLTFNALLDAADYPLLEVRLLRHQTHGAAGKTPYTLWRDDPSGFVTWPFWTMSASTL